MFGSLNRRAAGRFLWKELRQGVPLAVAFALIAFVLTGVAAMLVQEVSELSEFVSGLWFCLFGVLIGSILFASEKENRTFINLQSLPIRWNELFVGKVLAGLICVVSVPVLLIVALGFDTITAAILPGALMYFAIALVMSTRFESILNAALAAIATGSLIDGGLTWINSTPSTNFLSIETYAAIGGFRMVFAMAFLLGSIPLSRRWWLGATTEWRRQDQSLAVQERARTRKLVRASQSRTLVHLAWQSMHENFRGILTIAACTLSPCLILKLIPVQNGSGEFPIFIASLIGVTMWLTCYLAGTACFAKDQRDHSFRFFVQHKEHPRLVWLARNGFWLTVVLLICGSLILLSRVQISDEVAPWSLASILYMGLLQSSADTEQILMLGSYLGSRSNVYLILGGLLIYGISQLCSQQFRSSVYAGFVAGFLSILAIGWTLICLVSGAPWILSLLPLVLAAFSLSWFWAPHWLVERNMNLGRMLSAAVLLVTSVGCILVVNLHQANVIPELNRTWTWNTPESPEIWEEARNKFLAIEFAEWPREEQPINWTKKHQHYFGYEQDERRKIAEFAAKNQVAVNRFYEAQDYVERNWDQFAGIKFQLCRWSVEEPVPLEEPLPSAARNAIWLEAEAALIEKDSDRAWRAVRGLVLLEKQTATLIFPKFEREYAGLINEWLALPDVTPDQIQNAIEDLEKTALDPWELMRYRVAGEYEPNLRGSQTAEAFLEISSQFELSHPIDSASSLTRWIIPSDAIRKSRWDRHIEKAKNYQVDEMQAKQAEGSLPLYFSQQQSLFRYLPKSSQLIEWFSHSLTPVRDARFFSEPEYNKLEAWRLLQRTRRDIAIRTKMAIVCYRLQEGRLPETLGQLVEAGILKQPPLDPVTNQPLAWLPNGINRPIVKKIENAMFVRQAPSNVGLLFCSPVANLQEIETRVITPKQYDQFEELNPENPEGELVQGMFQSSQGPKTPEQSMNLFWIAPLENDKANQEPQP